MHPYRTAGHCSFSGIRGILFTSDASVITATTFTTGNPHQRDSLASLGHLRYQWHLRYQGHLRHFAPTFRTYQGVHLIEKEINKKIEWIFKLFRVLGYRKKQLAGTLSGEKEELMNNKEVIRAYLGKE